jgi:hypothetical protein
MPLASDRPVDNSGQDLWFAPPDRAVPLFLDQIPVPGSREHIFASEPVLLGSGRNHPLRHHRAFRAKGIQEDATADNPVIVIVPKTELPLRLHFLSIIADPYPHTPLCKPFWAYPPALSLKVL